MSFITNAAALAANAAPFPILPNKKRKEPEPGSTPQVEQTNAKIIKVGTDSLSSPTLSLEDSNRIFLEKIAKAELDKTNFASIQALDENQLVPMQFETKNCIFSGNCRMGVPNGEGEKIFKRHPFFKFCKGNFENGEFHGEGYLELINGSIFKGTFDHGKIKNGMFTIPKVFCYIGEFSNLEPKGKGEMTFEPGNSKGYKSYRGQFEMGEFDGEGVLKYENGDRYSGGFSQGGFDGSGTFYTKISDTIESVFYENGVLQIFDEETPSIGLI